ncbi:MAG: DUF4234 domain-containing protein [Candidatus Saccharimonadales bacterium]
MQKRNPFVVVILSIITLGIYDIYWLVKTKTELNAKTSQHVPSIWLLVSPIIPVVVGYILLLIGAHGSQSTQTNYYGTTVVTNSSSGGNHSLILIGVVIMVIGWIAVLFLSMWWLYKFSKAVNEYTHGKMSTAVTFLILWLIHLIGVALVQDTFNDMLDQPMAAASAAPGGPMPPFPQAGIAPPPMQPTPPQYSQPAGPTADAGPVVSPPAQPPTMPPGAFPPPPPPPSGASPVQSDPNQPGPTPPAVPPIS